MQTEKLKQLILENGGSEYHVLWAEYFMKPPFIPNSKRIEMPTDQFLSTIDYSPLSIQNFLDGFSKINSGEKVNINDIFRELFHVSDFNLIGTAILAQMAQNQHMLEMSTSDDKVVKEYIFRGLIVFILKLPRLIIHQTSDQNDNTNDDKIYNEKINNDKINIEKINNDKNECFYIETGDSISLSEWPLMRFFILYLSTLNNPFFSDFMICLEPLTEIFRPINHVLLMPKESPILEFFFDMLKIMVSSTNQLMAMNKHNLILYITNCFLANFSIKLNVSCEDNMIQYYSVFVKILGYSDMKNISVQLKALLHLMISTFLTKFEKIDVSSSDSQLFTLGIDSITLIKYAESDELSTSFLFARGVISFINWANKKMQFYKIFANLGKYEEKPETLIFQTFSEYFHTHRVVELHTSIIRSKEKKRNYHYKILINCWKKVMDNLKNFDFFTQGIVSLFDDISKIGWIVILSKYPYTRITYNETYDKIINKLLSFDIFDRNKAIEKTNHYLLDCILNFLLNFFTTSQISRQDILKNITSRPFSNMMRIMPLFRSLLLLEDQINFIRELLITNFLSYVTINLSKKEYEKEIDAILSFLQVCAVKNPILTMSSFSFVPLFTESVMYPRYTKMIMKCFKIGLCLKDSFETVTSVSAQIAAILIQAIEEHTGLDVSLDFVMLLSQSIYHFPAKIIFELERQSIFDSISKLPTITKSKKCIMITILFFLKFFEIFPDYTYKFERKFIYEHLKRGFEETSVDSDILLLLFQLVMNRSGSLEENSSQTIQNKPALRFLLDVVNKCSDNDIKIKTLEFFHHHCIKNAVNCYICFQSGILDFALDNIENDLTRNMGLDLYKTVAQLFYSSRDLRHAASTAKKNNLNCQYLIDKLDNMLQDKNSDNVTSFFHFSGQLNEKIHAILEYNNVSNNNFVFSNEWSIAMVVLIGEKRKQEFISIISNSIHLHFFFEGSNLCIERDNNKRMKFNFKFLPFIWYSIALTFNGRIVSLYVNKKPAGELDMAKKLTFIGNCEVIFGKGFIGEIGETFFFDTIKLNDIYHGNRNEGKALLKFLPRNVDNQVLIDTGATKCFIECAYVPFCTTFKECIISPTTFPLFLQLFNLIDNSTLFHLLLHFIQQLFILSPENEIFFINTGGFQLFVGLMKNHDVFNEESCDYLLNVYKSMSSKALKMQMVESIWLNFEFLFKLNANFLNKFFNETLLKAYNDNIDYFHGNFLNSDYVIGSICSKTQYQKVIFEIFYKISENLDSTIILFKLFLQYQFSTDSELKINILLFYLKIIENDLDQLIKMLPVFGYYEKFYHSLYSKCQDEQNISLEFILKLIGLEEKNAFTTSTLLKAVSYMSNDQNLATKLLENMNNNKYPELIFLLCTCVPFSNEKEKINTELQKRIMSNPSQFKYFYMCPYSSLYIFIYCFNQIEYWDTFTPFFVENPEILFAVFYIISSYSIYKEVKMFEIEKHILINAMRYARKKSSKSLFDIALLAVKFLCFESECNKNQKSRNNFLKEEEKTETNSLFDEITNFITWLSNSNSDKSIHFVVKFKKDYTFIYLLYQILSDISFDDQNSMVEITSNASYPIFSLICILISYIIENSEGLIDKNSAYDFFMKAQNQKTPEQINQIYFSLGKANLIEDKFNERYPNAMKDDSLYKDFLILIENETMQYMIDYKIMFKDFLNNLSSMIKIDSESKINIKSFEMFSKNYIDKKDFFENYFNSLSQSFLREMNGNSFELKWKISNEIDSFGYRCYMSNNKFFDDHQKASIMRDIGVNKDTEVCPQHEKVIIAFKRILDQTTQQETIKNASGVALLITLTGRYDAIFSFDEESVVFGGRMTYDGLGIEINQSNLSSVPNKFVHIKFDDVKFIFNRHFLHLDTACEIFVKNRKSYLLNFPTVEQRTSFYSQFKCKDTFLRTKKGSKDFHFFYELRKASNGIFQNLPSHELFSKIKIAQAWQKRQLTNYQYIYYLNMLSGRSFNDISQYPVYPWVISQYNSDSLDFSDPNIYRDLSIPMAAYTQERLKACVSSMNDAFESYEKCMFRVFYSNPGMVIGYLIRCEPFTTLHIKLQSGKFDFADRLFQGIEYSFNSASSSVGDYSELLPEFYTNHHFLVNENNFDLGCMQNKVRVNNVILPKWAKNPKNFIEMNKYALESEYVRMHLNEWIDLIFGIYQKSIEKNNLFHLYSYSDCIHNPSIIEAGVVPLAQHHAANFGCSPEKLLIKENHPTCAITIMKNISASYSKNLLVLNSANLNNLVQNLPVGNLVFFSKTYFLTENGKFGKIGVNQNTINIGYDFEKIITKISHKVFIESSKVLVFVQPNGSYSTALPMIPNSNSHIRVMMHKSSLISCICSIDDEFLVTGGSDCCINIWNRSFELFVSIPILSHKLVAVSGNNQLDRIVTIDESHQIYVVSLRKKKVLYSFNLYHVIKNPNKTESKIDNSDLESSDQGNSNLTKYDQEKRNNENADQEKFNQETELIIARAVRHGILLLNNGLIVVSSENGDENEAKIDIFDITGQTIMEKTITIKGEIVKMFPVNRKNECLVIVSMTTKHFYIINCTTFENVRKWNELISPDFICIADNHEDLLAANGNRILRVYEI
ncbi:hypothetical protein TRFO_11638 [Tritrichomonas foetus]|uniref:Beige/BEACH domain containing protein n=1 Tax=Tritrichomonas foetus TaxID=1144522 RepID=A0A1J4J7K1_9EUKA|nr:hypothetical protein TRFO_11638 [Tritrichomonas foetus]|eukprot:OHS93643.1 hypothetical protein TRFO_11638 [Tritrichomonas foetus]